MVDAFLDLIDVIKEMIFSSRSKRESKVISDLPWDITSEGVVEVVKMDSFGEEKVDRLFSCLRLSEWDSIWREIDLGLCREEEEG